MNLLFCKPNCAIRNNNNSKPSNRMDQPKCIITNNNSILSCRIDQNNVVLLLIITGNRMDQPKCRITTTTTNSIPSCRITWEIIIILRNTQ